LTIPPSHPGSARKDAFLARLIAMRKAAGLSGNALAKRIGIGQPHLWKIEHGETWPTENTVRAWARETDNEQEIESLMEALAEARGGERSFSVEISQHGGAAFEDRVGRAELRATRVGEFSSAVVPGILQTADYARHLLGVASGLTAWDPRENAIEEKVAARLRRQEILYDPGKRVQVVITEYVLRCRIVPAPVLIAQLGKLLAVLRLPSVELGVIGFDQRVPTYPYGVRVLDDELAVVESPVDEHEYTAAEKPKDLATLLEQFNEMRLAASTGAEAETIIQGALDHLQRLV